VVLGDAEVEPEVLGLEVGGEAKAALEVGDVEAVGREAKDLGEERPRHLGRLGLLQERDRISAALASEERGGREEAERTLK